MENKYSRKAKEKEVLSTFFAALLNKFHQTLFSVNFDDPNVPDVDVFGLFNKSWKQYASQHNKKAKRIFADSEAFENYAIKQDNE